MENLLKELQKRGLGLDEVVFEHRNKAYGAYQLRHGYGSNLSKAMFIGIGLFISVAALPFIINSFKSDAIIEDVITGPPTMVHIQQDIEEPTPPQATTPPQQQQVVNTVEYIIPTPSRHVDKEKPIASTTEINDAAIGIQTIDAPTAPNTYVPITPPVIGTGNVPTVPTTSTAPPKDPNAIPSHVDVEASFRGGVEAFRRVIGENFDTSEVDQSGVISTVVTFVVEKDGSISNVKAKGTDADFNREAERTIKDIRTKWTPAKLDGESVRSYFRIPISMKIE
ncbi:protein TonB [Soonwooa buanensis]|uniref:Protein TonB n=1 Tax=Soonwooa buanensis TaxID=619805 RepID=A0A1T5DLR2_9FLAO|nr:energy transducer TonB [Soonwooa buanensis]SKB72629.1 protein TonB [Soonwooa buanensis]